MNTRLSLRRFAAIAVAGGLLATGVTAPAFAAETNVTVSGSNLTLSTVTAGDFQAVSLNGANQNTTATLNQWSVTDARGSGVGWKVTASATQFAEYENGAPVPSGKTIPTSSLSLANPSVTVGTGSSATPNSATGGTLDGGEAITIVTAAAGTGMGTYTFGDATLTLAIPASTYAKTYRSTVTVTLAETP